MKVAELIQKLSRMNPDAEVVIPVQDRDGWVENTLVEIAAYDPAGSGHAVIHYDASDWLCNFPRQPRNLSESEKRVQEITRHAMQQMAESLAKNWDYQRDWLNTPGYLRIRMPEVK